MNFFNFDQPKIFCELIFIASFSAIECFVRRAAKFRLILISLWILMLKTFPLYKFVDANNGQYSQIRAQLMTETIYNKQNPTRLHYDFRIKLRNSFILLSFLIILVAK